MSSPPKIILFGATGTIGRATYDALITAGYRVICPVRDPLKAALPEHAETCPVELTNPATIQSALGQDAPSAVVSCLASRSGAPADTWSIDHDAHLQILTAAKAAGIRQFVQLSAICVQRPMLEFQHAKLAFEAKLIDSGLTYSIVRPTAYFKSLSGQLNRLKAGKPFLLFGNGALTACKPISDRDLANYLTRCLSDPSLQNKILPIGGPGPALTPRQHGEALFKALDIEPKFKHVPVALMSAIITSLTIGGKLSKSLKAKAELAKIGRYYATQSMLVYNDETEKYDAEATPETGQDTLTDHYKNLASGAVTIDLGDHAVF